MDYVYICTPCGHKFVKPIPLGDMDEQACPNCFGQGQFQLLHMLPEVRHRLLQGVSTCVVSEKEHCGTGATRSTDCIDDRYDLMYWPALRRLAKRYGLGAKNHGEHNFRDGGMPATVIVKHLVHHLVDWIHGIKPEDDHLAAVAWGIFALMEREDERPNLIDLRFREVDYATTHNASEGPTPCPGDETVIGGYDEGAREEAGKQHRPTPGA